MSQESFSVNNYRTLINLIKKNYGSVLFCDISERVNVLLKTECVVSVLEGKKTDNEIIRTFCEILLSIKLLIECADWSANDISVEDVARTVENIFQCVREVIDNNACEELAVSALDLLNALSVLCCNRTEFGLTPLANFFMYQLHLLLHKISEDSVGLRLRAINVVLETVANAIGTNLFDAFSGVCLTIGDNVVDEHKLFSNLLFHCHESISAQAMLTVLPLYLKIFKRNVIAYCLWNEAVDPSSCNHLRQFTILCFLFDLFSTDKEDVGLAAFELQLQEERFWKVIQDGLRDSSHVVRRQALYLLKRCIQEISERRLVIASRNLKEVSGQVFHDKLDDGAIKLINGMKNVVICNSKMFLVSQKEHGRMWWDPQYTSNLNKIFDDVFLVFESAEEKQAHIVKPVCATMERLISAVINPCPNGKTLSISWIFLLIRRLMAHDNVAVVRWSLRLLLQIDVGVLVDTNAMIETIQCIVSCCNSSAIFVGETDALLNDLSQYFEQVSNTTFAKTFFAILVREICDKSWSPEPLYLLLDSLKTVKVLSWAKPELAIMKTFIASSISTHYKFLRAAIQCQFVALIINLTDVSEVSLEALADVLISFRREECLERGSTNWKGVSTWLEYCFSKRNAEEFVLSHLSDSSPSIGCEAKISRMITLLYDAHLFGIMKCCGEAPSNNVITVFREVLASFKDADKRMYAAPKGLHKNLFMVKHILEENVAVNKSEPSHLVEIFIPHLGNILAYILCQLRTLKSISDFELCQTMVAVTKFALKAYQMYSISSEQYVGPLFDYVLKSLGVTDKVESSVIERFGAMNILRLILDYAYHEKAIPRLKAIRAFIKSQVNVSLEKIESDVSGDAKSVMGRINSEYLAAQWWIIGRLKAENLLVVGPMVSVDKFLEGNDLAIHCLTALELCGSSLLLPCLDVVEDLLPELSDDQVVVLVNTCWAYVEGCKKNEQFNPASRKFISAVFQAEVIRRTTLQPLLLQLSQSLLSETVNGLANAFISHVQILHVKYNCTPLWARVLAEAISFGALPRREDRLTLDVCSLIERTPCSANSLVANEWNRSRDVRARALSILLTLSAAKHSDFADDIADALIQKENEVTAGKSRSFAGSQIHYVRTRILQAMLVLEPILSKDKRNNLYSWLCTGLLRESQQPSVRYLKEWLVVRLVWREPYLYDSLWSQFTLALEQRVGSLCSFISIVYHVMIVLPNPVLEIWIDKAVAQFLPYCLAQHFSLRLYAQVALEKIWGLAVARGLMGVLLKYSLIRECLARSVGNGNALRNAEKMSTDFYWTYFNPLEHFSLCTIFRDLPRLSNLPEEEWLTPELLTFVGVPKNIETVPFSSGDLLWQLPLSAWTAHREEEPSEELAPEFFQKKMIPVKALVPNYEDLTNSSAAASRKKPVSGDGLIVIASLVDRAANLGGLSRTCEAFGVSQLVIDSLKIVQDKQFISLSVTSEKWVHITEVKSYHISDYLMSLKKDGYTVVGAEQTSRSQQLHQVRFPRKSALLLGNEKEGLPPQLLPYLDICVEVPQLGVIRSLNVHVTGAIFIWEYAKQQLLQEQES